VAAIARAVTDGLERALLPVLNIFPGMGGHRRHFHFRLPEVDTSKRSWNGPIFAAFNRLRPAGWMPQMFV